MLTKSVGFTSVSLNKARCTYLIEGTLVAECKVLKFCKSYFHVDLNLKIHLNAAVGVLPVLVEVVDLHNVKPLRQVNLSKKNIRCSRCEAGCHYFFLLRSK